MSSATHLALGTWSHVPSPAHDVAGSWSLDLSGYDRSLALTEPEREELALLARRRGRQGHWSRRAVSVLSRLRQPILDVLMGAGASENARCGALTVLVVEMDRRGTSFWSWTPEEWLDTLCASGRRFNARYPAPQACRAQLIAFAYLICPGLDLDRLGPFDRLALSRKVFGRADLDASIRRIRDALVGWGYRETQALRMLHMPVCEALLANRSPRLEDLTGSLLNSLRERTRRKHLKDELYTLGRALFGLGILDQPPTKAFRPEPGRDPTVGLAADWVAACQRWRDTSTLSPNTRQSDYLLLLQAGRWLAAAHPGVTKPEHWTRELAAEYVAAVDRLVVGAWAATALKAKQRTGKPLSPKAKMHHLNAMSAFFRDAQEWGWLPRRFDPRRCFAVPRAIRALAGPNPRVLADDIWAKLLWAGLNLTDEDLGRTYLCPTPFYPAPMMRALAVVWLFAGLRSDEISRLRVGCIRWQREDVTVSGTRELLPKDAVCLLDVPTNKTAIAFTKPVDPAVGEAIAAWEQARPRQPAFVDGKTGEVIHPLFALRGARLSKTYLNDRLIPLLCRKAGVPEQDARGEITSHRARATIASQLFNAREPMSLFDLQAWLGHRWPASTQHYVQVAPTRLAKAYADAGYFGRNLRLVEVLVDAGAVRSGAAAAGEPWRFYDLGHGYCTYDFFDQCPHRMACAKCAFYHPKGSTQAQLLEGKANLLRLKQEIPLTGEEAAAVDDGLEALERLCAQLADVPTPAGPTPRQLRRDLPVVSSPTAVVEGDQEVS